jgi:hypothetical protein
MCRTSAALTAALLLAGPGAGRAVAAVDPAGMLRKADASRDAFSEGVIRLRVVVNERGKTPIVNLLQLFVKGNDRSLLVFRDGKQQGRKILTLGDRVFLIVPGASRPIPVSKTQRLMGTASFGDVARVRLNEDYDATLRPGEERIAGSRGEAACRVLDLVAKRPGAAYPAAVLWIGQDDGLARRLRLSLASGKQAKEVLFTSYDSEDRIAAMEIRDLLTGGGANVTKVAFESYEKRPLDPAMFDPEGARAVP